MTQNKTFYTYVLIDPRDETPFYVGKGTGGRSNEHVSKRSHNHLVNERVEDIETSGLKVKVVKNFHGSEDMAFHIEESMIAYLGRTDLGKGPLLNKSKGGSGGSSGWIATNEYRDRHRQKTTAMWQDDDYRKKVSSGLKKAFSEKEGWSETLSEKFKSLWQDDDYRAKQIKNLKEINSRPEVKESKRQKAKANWDDPVYREKCTKGAAEYMRSDEGRAKKSAGMKKVWSDPSYKDFARQRMIESYQTHWIQVYDFKFSRAVDAAEFFGVSVSTVNNWVRSGKALKYERA